MNPNRKEESIEIYEKLIALNPENGKEMLPKTKQNNERLITSIFYC